MNPSGDAPGVFYNYYQFTDGTGDNTDELTLHAPVSTGIRALPDPVNYNYSGNPTGSDFDLSVATAATQFGFIWTGYVNIPAGEGGVWTFFTASDDGSVLFIDGNQVVNNDGGHGTVEQSGTIDLQPGKHAVVLFYTQGFGGFNVGVAWQGPTLTPKQGIPNAALSVEPTQAANPVISVANHRATITSATAGATIYYTLDGTDPRYSATRVLYSGPFAFTGGQVISAIAQGLNPSGASVPYSISGIVRGGATNMIPGLAYKYYPNTFGGSGSPLPNNGARTGLDTLVPFSLGLIDPTNPFFGPGITGTSKDPNGNLLRVRAQDTNISLKYTGYFLAQESGTYTFYTSSDDGSMLYIDGNQVVYNNYYQGVTQRSGAIALTAGAHRYELLFSQGPGGFGLLAAVALPNGTYYDTIPDTMLFCQPVAPVVISGATSFSGSTPVSLSCATPGAQILYTLDGTVPDPNNSAALLYTGPLTVSRTTTLRTAAYLAGYDTIGIQAQTFTNTIPSLVSVVASGDPTKVAVNFDQPVAAPSATALANYQISNGVTISGASVNGATVTLTVSPLSTGTTYTLTASNILSVAGGTLPAGSNLPFQFFATDGVLFEEYDNLPNGASLISDLTSSPLFPNFPTTGSILPTAEVGNINQNFFGERLRGYFYPATTGSYTFYVASDDTSALYLSTDDTPAHTQLIAHCDSAVNGRQWTATAVQMSAPVALTAGQRYYFEGLMVQFNGPDHFEILAVPSGTPVSDGDAPMPTNGDHIAPYVEQIHFVAQPQYIVVPVGANATFAPVFSGSAPRTYVWTRDGATIGGATGSTYTLNNAQLSDSGSVFSATATNALNSASSQTTTLIVYDPAATPAMTSVSPNIGPALGNWTVTLSGSNFVPGQTQVFADGYAALSVTGSATSLTAVLPAHPAGTVDVTVIVPGGGTNTLASSFTYVAPPTVTAISPASGQPGGGQIVAISGTNFVTGYTTVKLGNSSATLNTLAPSGIAGTALTATTGVSPEGTVDVIVTTFGSQTFTYSAAYTYRRATPTLGLSATQTTSILFDGVVYTTSLSGIYGTPTGTIQYQADGLNLGAAVALNNGIAVSPSITSLAAGSHTISAVYSGDINYVPGTATLPVTVVLGPPPTFSSPPFITPNPAIAGQPISGSASADAAVGTATLTWDFGDGTTATGANISHTYMQAGVYTVTVTATSPQGVVTTQTQQVFVGFGATNGGAASPGDGSTGLLVSGALGYGQILIHYTQPSRSTFKALVKNIKFPSTLTLNALNSQFGTLTLGPSNAPLRFTFSILKNGMATATALSQLKVDLRHQCVLVKTNGTYALNDLVAALGAPYQPGVTNIPGQTLSLPATLEIGNDLFLALTFKLNYQQAKGLGKGATAK